jgi:hypothetical protein
MKESRCGVIEEKVALENNELGHLRGVLSISSVGQKKNDKFLLRVLCFL